MSEPASRPAAEQAAAPLSGPACGRPAGARAAERPAAPTRAAAARDPWPVRLDRVSVRRGGRAAVDALTLRLDPGGVLALMGPNGAGKSLTLRLLAGLIAPDEGAATWAGRPTPPRGAVGVVFQRPALLRRSTLGNVTHALALAGAPRRARRARAMALLAQAGLTHRADAPARALSGGEQQRLALARALACAPALLLLDEPTANLDPRATAQVEALLREVCAQGVTALVVTHDAGQARRVADEVAFLHNGRLTERTPAREFFARPASPEGRAYLEGRLLL
ncbi:ATP-binding cassette domain-containing protein [Oceanicella actignis]|uniref:Tungstate transport system ATP-binding protein n=1 Tax=Oceanicella actignis TaxID=1189325 RepID=A0A1M7S2A5_9RHOB|nr:ATP-binding cassette domain-containing protein [Oceanicella actignis]SES90629.1 phosphate ABC transporter ATP-binding protein, PhoT family [Oceanicella actignis]SHN52611.1 tungstate transport system ATP-binding protein [Oceanicella actignis]